MLAEKKSGGLVEPMVKTKLLTWGVMMVAALAGRAAVFTNIYNFTGNYVYPGTNSDGANPRAGVAASGGVVYGVTQNAGGQSRGSVFAVHTDGSGFTNLHTFNTLTGPINTNSDGANPWGGLIVAGGVLYGTAPNGGTGGAGTVFSLGTNGAGFQTLFSFPAVAMDNQNDTRTNSDGAEPYGRLLLSNNLLYGTALDAGLGGYGTVFAVNTNGTNFQVLHGFDLTDGSQPNAGVVLAGSNLCGATISGGNLYGTVFSVSTNGLGFTNTYIFSGPDGYQAYGDLALSGGNLYGTTVYGGTNGAGDIYAIGTSGAHFGILYSFSTVAVNSLGNATNRDGLNPYTGLLLVGKNLYGVASAGGHNGYGTVFGIGTNGMGFTTLHSFTVPGGADLTNTDGYSPYGLLSYYNGTLYGTTEKGGIYGNGSVFGVTIFPTLNITRAGTNSVILSWNDPAFSLQAATNLTGVYTNVPGAISPHTNAINGSQLFFRLVAE